MAVEIAPRMIRIEMIGVRIFAPTPFCTRTSIGTEARPRRHAGSSDVPQSKGRPARYRRTSASWRRFPDRYPLSCRPAPVSYIQLYSFLFPLVLFDFDALKHCVVIARKYRDVEKKYQICRWRGKKETRDWTKCQRKRDRNLRRR